jgi:DNA-binding NarL/FixJ family response regulator
VLIVDKSPVFRAGLEAILADSEFRNVVSYSNLFEFKIDHLPKRIGPGSPTIVLLGIDDQRDDDFSRVVELVRRGVRVVILCDGYQPEALLAALEIGAVGCLAKSDVEPAMLVSTLKLICLGGLVISHGFARFKIVMSDHSIRSASNDLIREMGGPPIERENH